MSSRQTVVAAVGALTLFLAIQIGALALVEPFNTAGYQAVEDPQDPANSIVYVLAILIATGVILAAFRLGIDRVVQLLVIAASALIGFYVFSVLFPPTPVPGLDGPSSTVVAALAALLLATALLVHPEWYVIDAAGVIMGAGAAGLFGISFGLLPALVLLVVLAAYDAISVYGTEHMLTLASGVIELKVPVVLVVPLSLSYSYLDATRPTAGRDDNEDQPSEDTSADRDSEISGPQEPFERDAYFIGLGDAVIPSVLVASAAVFVPETVPVIGVPGLRITATAAGAGVGTLVSLIVLLWLVSKGRAHAGLPLLNGGAIAGYLVTALASGLSLHTAIGL